MVSAYPVCEHPHHLPVKPVGLQADFAEEGYDLRRV